MKIEYQDGGEELRLLITSWFFLTGGSITGWWMKFCFARLLNN